jgi:hypothetical protein
MDDTDASDMFLKIEYLRDSTNVVTSSDVSKMSRLILDPLDNLSLFKIVLDSVSLVNLRMGESNCSGIACDDIWDLVRANCLLGDFQQFEFGLCFFDLDKGKSSLDIIEHSVVFICLGKRDGIHDSYWELDGSSDFIINSDACFLILDDNVGLTSVEAEFEVVPV